MTRQQILEHAKAMPPHERDELIEDLRQISADDLTPEQMAELKRRIEAVERGEMKLIPGEQVIDELRRRLAR